MRIRISERGHGIQTVVQLAVAIEKAWDQIPVDFLAKLCNSMGTQLDLLVQPQGGPVKYI